MKMKKLMSGLLALAMATTMLTIPAFAAALSDPTVAIDYELETYKVTKQAGSKSIVAIDAATTKQEPADADAVAAWGDDVTDDTDISLTASIPATGAGSNYIHALTITDPFSGTFADEISATVNKEIIARPATPVIADGSNGGKVTFVDPVTDGSDASITISDADSSKKYEYSINGGNWTEVSATTAVSLSTVDATDVIKVRLKAVALTSFASEAVSYTFSESTKTALKKEWFEMTTPKVAYKGAAYDNTANAVKLTSAGSAEGTIALTDVDITFPTEATNAGKKTVTIAAKPTSDYQGIVTLEFEVTKKALAITKPADNALKMDFNGQVNFSKVSIVTTPAFTALVGSEYPKVTITGKMTNANVDTGKLVTGIAVKIEDNGTFKASNYEFTTAAMATALQQLKVEVEAKAVTGAVTLSTDATAALKVGDKVTVAIPNSPVTGKALVKGTDYAIAWEFASSAEVSLANANPMTIPAGKTGVITAEITYKGNYKSDTGSAVASDALTIGKVAVAEPVLFVNGKATTASTVVVAGDVLTFSTTTSDTLYNAQWKESTNNLTAETNGSYIVKKVDAGKTIRIVLTGKGTAADNNKDSKNLTVANVPTAPTGVIVRSATGTLNLTLTGQTNGGAPITKIEYTITDGTTTNNVFADVVGERSVTIKNLENGKEYTISAIKTQNAMGLSSSAYGSSVTGTPQRTASGGGSTGSSGSSGSSSGTTTIEPSLPANATATSVKVGADVPAEVTNVPSSATIVADTKPITTEIAKRAEGFGIKQLLNIDLKDGTTKITAIEGGKVKVTLPFAGVTGKQYVALRFNNDGTTSVIPATYVDGNITFNTNHFSLYAIAEVGGKTVVNGTTTGGTTTGGVPQTGIATLAPLF